MSRVSGSSKRGYAEIQIGNLREFKRTLSVEWTIIVRKLDEIMKGGTNAMLSSLVVGEYARKYFAGNSLFCGGC